MQNHYRYSQTTGEFSCCKSLIAVGYSGNTVGKNQPNSQHVQGIGPIPRGEWVIEKPPSKEKGPLTFRLSPQLGTQTFGRSGFLIHGDSKEHPGKASSGCIVLGHDARMLLDTPQPDLLTVVE